MKGSNYTSSLASRERIRRFLKSKDPEHWYEYVCTTCDRTFWANKSLPKFICVYCQSEQTIVLETIS